MQLLTYGSVCSGIEAASIAWEPLGLIPLWFSQYDPEHNYAKGPDFPSKVLAHHWPDTPNLGDMTAIAARIASCVVDAPDILVGGTPCQAYSVAGKREGLNDPRGLLTLKFVEIADEIDKQRPNDECVIVWENVPGVLSSKDNAFGCFLGDLAGENSELQPSGDKWSNAGCVFGPKRAIAWRVLDAQYFGVAQRRRRVFVVASARAGFNPCEVLFESEGLRRDTPPSREARKEVAGAPTSSTGSHWGCELNAHPTLNQSHNVGGIGASNQEIFSQRGAGLVGALDTECGYQSQAFQSVLSGHIVGAYRMTAFGEYSASTCKARDYKDATDLVVEVNPAIRRLTPVECERLQGFSDNHTKLNGSTPDGHRYKAIGNSMAVPVMRWIGRRLLSC